MVQAFFPGGEGGGAIAGAQPSSYLRSRLAGPGRVLDTPAAVD